MPEYKVNVAQLRVGVFISLSGNWLDHPFLFSNFKISKDEQIRTLQELGITEVICIPEKSDVLPLPPARSAPERPETPAAPAVSLETRMLWEQKKERLARLKVRKERDEQCERQFTKSITAVKGIMKNIEAGSEEAFEESDKLMRGIAESLLPNRESAVQLMNTAFGKENVFFHSLNVAVLSMMLAREYGLDADSMRIIGLGGLFHDIGKSRIPKSILHKETALTRAEEKFLQLHPKYGVDVLSQLKQFPAEAMKAVSQHHEHQDGSGFPQGLKGKDQSLAARIVAIANVYDNHCNHLDPADSLTPHTALAYMFSHQKDLFDRGLLALFIQCLGVYPPGTIVTLSNGLIGMVLSVNPRDPLHPSLLIYNPDIPKKEALIFDLADEPGVRIESSLRPAKLAPEVYEYLSPRTRVTYYVAAPADQATVQKPRL